MLRDDEGNEGHDSGPRSARRRCATREKGPIAFHGEDRRGFHNVYLDSITSAEPSDAGGRDSEYGQHPDESAWDTALGAAPRIIGTREPREALPPRVTSCRSVSVSAISALRRQQSSASQDSIRVKVR